MNLRQMRFALMSDEKLYQSFASSNWNRMSVENRKAALQELGNRVADEYGIERRPMWFEPMSGGYFGSFDEKENVVRLNRYLVEEGRQYMAENGQLYYCDRPDAPAELVNTVYHEYYHAYQRDAIDGKVTHPDPMEVKVWESNFKRDAGNQLVNYYSNQDKVDPRYNVQSGERTADRKGEEGVRKVFESNERTLGKDQMYEEYKKSHACDSYSRHLQDAISQLQDPNIEENLDKEMLMKYCDDHGIDYKAEDSYKDVCNRIRQAEHPELGPAEPASEKSLLTPEQERLKQYMDDHGYSPENQTEYKRDPEWQRLHQAVYGEREGINNLPPDPSFHKEAEKAEQEDQTINRELNTEVLPKKAEEAAESEDQDQQEGESKTAEETEDESEAESEDQSEQEEESEAVEETEDKSAAESEDQTEQEDQVESDELNMDDSPEESEDQSEQEDQVESDELNMDDSPEESEDETEQEDQVESDELNMDDSYDENEDQREQEDRNHSDDVNMDESADQEEETSENEEQAQSEDQSLSDEPSMEDGSLPSDSGESSSKEEEEDEQKGMSY
ncbi:hypothetical protein [uncultured Allobaculum sp.]|uniref:hypothetical protein n=1 Tax=uncultured Allobaculum sp. TaxID=1187017 RepID=UPI00261A2F08|nr:hypothetical protein [uncultured Allobaculum sp.]